MVVLTSDESDQLSTSLGALETLARSALGLVVESEGPQSQLAADVARLVWPMEGQTDSIRLIVTVDADPEAGRATLSGSDPEASDASGSTRRPRS